MKHFHDFRSAIFDLISLRQARLEALCQPDPDFVAALVDLGTMYTELLNRTVPFEKEAIGEFYREALEVFGSPENIFHEYQDAAGLLYWLRFEAGRKQLMEGLRLAKERGDR